MMSLKLIISFPFKGHCEANLTNITPPSGISYYALIYVFQQQKCQPAIVLLRSLWLCPVTFEDETKNFPWFSFCLIKVRMHLNPQSPKWSLHFGQMMSFLCLQDTFLIPASVLLLLPELNNLSPTILSNFNSSMLFYLP